jgi:tRNA pseudouridine55 synthase
MDGLIVVDKPGGCTSHDVVLRLRKLLRTPKAGHCGTLDPDATGILLLAVGRAVRFFPYLSRQDKIYEASIRLGFSTDTYDASGQATSPESRTYPARPELLEAMRKWEGEILQIPPAFSAKKIGGRPMHKLARAGREVQPRPARVVVREFGLLEYAPPRVLCRIACSSGTYVRSLAHDLGRELGCGAHLSSLRRTAVGTHTLPNAWTLEEIEEAARSGLSEFLIPLEELLPEFPGFTLGPEDEARVRNGVPLPVNPAFRTVLEETPPGGGPVLIKLFGPSGNFVALARLSPEKDRFHPFLVLPPSP